MIEFINSKGEWQEVLGHGCNSDAEEMRYAEMFGFRFTSGLSERTKKLIEKHPGLALMFPNKG